MRDNLFRIVKVIVLDIIITIVGVLLLSFFAYKFRLGNNTIKIGIVIIYVLSNFFGGFIIGKIKESKKYIWGAVTGIVYFVILTIVSVIVTGDLFGNGNMALVAFFSSVISSTVGGMVS